MKESNIILKKLLNVSRLILIILCVNLIVLSLGVSSYINNNKGSKEETKEEYNTEYDVSMFEEITASDIAKKTKKTSVLYVGRSSCSWCAAFLPNLWKAQETYGYKTLYIDIAKIIDFENNKVSDEAAYKKMMALTGKGYEKYMEENFGATPMILIMKDGKIINAQTGYSEYEDFEKILKDSGFKK